jgi:glycerophosphoryl diester phosphodiesterase
MSSLTKNAVVISHRGAAGLAPENTLAALREAINQGVGLVEVDVHRTADGVLVLMHDETVDRTTDGTGAVRGLTWDEISKLDAGSHFSPKFAGESVPSLDSALELIAEWPVTLVLEVKNPHLYPGIEQQILEAVKRFDASDRVIVMSFDHGWLERFKENKLASDITIGLISWLPCNMAQIASTRVVSVYWPSVLLPPTSVRRIHNQGYQVWVWTVNDTRLMRLLVWLGVDGIITDRPDRWPEGIGTGQ